MKQVSTLRENAAGLIRHFGLRRDADSSASERAGVTHAAPAVPPHVFLLAHILTLLTFTRVWFPRWQEGTLLHQRPLTETHLGQEPLRVHLGLENDQQLILSNDKSFKAFINV